MGIGYRSGLAAACILAASFGGAAFGAGPVELAGTLLAETGLEPIECPAFVVEQRGEDLSALCGRSDGGAKQGRKLVEQAIAGPALSRYSFQQVLDWAPVAKGRLRAAYWLGNASIDVLVDKSTATLAVLASRIYSRCGNDVPFAPGSAGGGSVPITLAPASYPVRAAREKIDGSAALAVRVEPGRRPEVLCIHHASPAGYGFELSAIEAVRLWSAGYVPGSGDTDAAGRTLNVLVDFSKADQRRTGSGTTYH